MQILTSQLYEKQLKEILVLIMKHDFTAAQNFKTYLDTIILNIPTKEKKYKKSLYFDDENIKDVLFQGCIIIFYSDKQKDTFYILGITTKG
ncbi:hypothetical protein JHD48_06315 [Sulfurimonas sp. SAG-AH-194-I05]|nr:hypothetical protein [Sulfurimonas sp. SAG-AH-194-I05]MDF1875342.1 hypothetical protein [Sulfurimonas sp. SAG-AH-194-I05]